MTTHQHTSHLHAHDAHGDGDHESIHDHSGGDEHRRHGGHHEGRHGGHDNGHGHEDMLEVEQALERILANFAPLDAVAMPVLQSLGMTLAEDITSPLNLPPLANSAMDGYAVLHADIAAAGDTPPTLTVISAVAAGQVSADTVTQGNTIRIMTGAPVPAGADTVVPFEETDELDRRRNGQPLNEIVIRKALPLGSNVRPAGEDVSAGELVLSAGTVVRPAEAGVMASLGLATARVIRRPVVAVLSTGDELTQIGNALQPGHIYDSNSSSIAAAVIAAGGTPPRHRHRPRQPGRPAPLHRRGRRRRPAGHLRRRFQGRLRYGQGCAGATGRYELLVGADAPGQTAGVRFTEPGGQASAAAVGTAGKSG